MYSISPAIPFPSIYIRHVPLHTRITDLSLPAVLVWSLVFIIWYVSRYCIQVLDQRRFSIGSCALRRYQESKSEFSEPRCLPRPPKDSNIIEPLKDFDYRNVKPEKYRPFRSKGHVKMGLSQVSRNEWIKIDRNYLECINYRRFLLKNEQQYCIGSNPGSRPAILELYEETMIHHLPKRFPNMFSIKGNIFTNHVTSSRYLIDAQRLDEKYMLNVLAENMEEDFYFMCPDGDGEYRLQAFSSCFPQGLLSSSTLGSSVREIHKPVPGYQSRLGNGVDRYFRCMEPGTFIGRLNVSKRYSKINGLRFR